MQPPSVQSANISSWEAPSSCPYNFTRLVTVVLSALMSRIKFYRRAIFPNLQEGRRSQHPKPAVASDLHPWENEEPRLDGSERVMWAGTDPRQMWLPWLIFFFYITCFKSRR